MNRTNYKRLWMHCTCLAFTLTLWLMSFSSLAQSQGEPLKGRVTDTQGKPVSGAVLNVTEANRIAVSNKQGDFVIKKYMPGDEIYVTAPGYKEVVVKVSDQTNFVVVLEKDNDLYARTIATPYSQTQKKFVVNSMSTMTGAELEKHPVTVLQNGFPGEVTGVATLEERSEPGWSETSLYIRGLRTMNAAARTPLIIVDNIERDLSFLDAYPIETVTILKDAAATAIYGMRGANGVVFVTTKRGQAGKTQISLNQEFGFQAASGIPRQQNSYNYALTVNQARYLDGLKPLYTDQDIEYYRQAAAGTLDPSLRYNYVSTDWYDVMLRDLAPQNRTNLSLTGGNRATRYNVSLTYLRQEGLYDTKWTEFNEGYSTQHNLNRFNLRSNIDVDVNKFLSLSLDLGGRIDQISQPLANTFALFTFGTGENLPINPVFTPLGDFYLPNNSADKNAAALVSSTGIDYNRRRNLYSNVTATGNLDFITRGLKVKGLLGFDAYNTFQYTQTQNFDGFFYDPLSGTADDPSSYEYIRKRTAFELGNPTTIARGMNYNINALGSLNYERSFGKHQVDAQIMTRTYKNVVEGFASSSRFLTLGGMANYVFNNRYIAQFTGAYMGSDNYAKGDRFGFFPGASLGWVLSEEKWLKGKKVDLLKLRASLGRSGQTNIGVRRYPFQGEYVEGGEYNFGTTQSPFEGTFESAAGNRNIKWEVSDMLNLGLDFDLWGQKLYGQIDAFKEWRSNILINRSTVPDMYGVAVPQDSYGKAETIGTEIVLGHRSKFGSLRFNIEGMLTYNKGKITEMDELAPLEDYQRLTGNHLPFFTGENNLYYIKDKWAAEEALIASSHQDAIDNPDKYAYQGAMKLGNAVFVDQNGDRIINDQDRVPYGYTRIPELVPSLNLGFEWKGFDARVMLTAFLNRTVETRENMDYAGGWGGASTHEVTKTWGYYNDDPADPRNINAQYPRLSTTYSDNDRNFPRNQSTIWFRNGNFLSLRNVEFGYSLPLKVVSRINMSRARIYFRGYNLYNWSHFENGFDPESPLNYIWAYPKTKSFSLGLNVSF